MLQVNLFGNDVEISQSYQGDFHANPTALQENVWHLMTSVICGENFTECFARLAPDGSWERMYQDYLQVKMDGFSDEFSETWPKWGVLHGGYLFQPTIRELNSLGREFALWPRPIASDGKAWTLSKRDSPMVSIRKCWRNGKEDRTIYYHIQSGLSAPQAADINEMMMGFPKGWTDLNVSETQ